MSDLGADHGRKPHRLPGGARQGAGRAPPRPTREPARPETIGRPAGRIPVELSARFLEHFSEHMYSSPQKAFEELISNGWDAGADCVDAYSAAFQPVIPPQASR